jgi:tetratricopeptide (TPR) repeat protein
MAQHDYEGAALRHFVPARELARWEVGIPDDDPRSLELALRLARALRLAGHTLAAEMLLEETSASADDRTDLFARSLVEHGRLHRARGRADAAVEAFHRAINRALSSGDPGLMIETYLELGELLTQQGREGKALEELAEGLLLSTKGEGELAVDGPRNLWSLLFRLAELHGRRGDHRRSLVLAERALFHARRGASAAGLARCHLLLGRLFAAEGRPELARENLTTARDPEISWPDGAEQARRL